MVLTTVHRLLRLACLLLPASAFGLDPTGTDAAPLPPAAVDIAALHARADLLHLAGNPYWHLLLRYGAPDSSGRSTSEARSASFFLSPDGRHDPSAELHAMLDGLFTSTPSGDDAIRCRFPARANWLQAALQIPLPPANCPGLTEWKRGIRPAQATLVFAADYLNSPSSMFGHTFLRLDAVEHTEDTRLLAYAVNYAANTGTSNSFVFAWKGLTGGFPGEFSLLPYYDKVKEYSDMENRDLWEYELTFTPDELQRLLDHLWELRNIEFPYYFLTRNCSYQLLSLLEAARPGLQLRKDFPLQAIPTDTLRRVLAEPGLLRKRVYRPAAERRLLQDARDNPDTVNEAARQLSRHPAMKTALSPRDEAAALETAYDYRYYRFMEDPHDPDARQTLRQLLVRRAEVDVPDQRTVPAEPPVDPAGGHATARIGLGAGQAQGAAYGVLRLRPAYHDLLDIPGGYRQGAHIDFLDGEVRIDDSRQALHLEQLRIIDIDSLANWDVFFHPASWFFGFGYRQAAVDDVGRFSSATSHGVAYIDGGAGASGGNDVMSCYVQAAAAVEAGPALERGWRAGAGPRLGCLFDLPGGRIRLQSDSRYYDNPGRMETRATLEGQLDLGARNGMRLQLGELGSGSVRQGFGEVSWVHYF